MGDLEFKLNSTDIHQNSEIVGTIDVSYPELKKVNIDYIVIIL